ncbi:MAG: rhodanese-like domain-containing protein [Rhodospirillales bacterium]|nr:rhodanese-like domain-containing protein [Rhodospirillales bacterium]
MVEDVPPAKTWEALRSDPKAQLVDVRTDAEWNFVGLPDLIGAAKQVVLIPWQIYPAMAVNERFAAHLREAGLTEDQHLYFICRTGGRSMAAARAAQAAGFAHAYNVADGFEGPPDEAGHRGTKAGWKASGLPWRQK